MLVTIDELAATSLYPEVLSAITRNDPHAAELQILSAEELCKSYLFKYDLEAIFGTASNEPKHPSELVKKLVKIIASYFLVRMASPNVNIELYRLDYQDAIKMLEDIRDGRNNPALPYAADNPDTPDNEAGDSFFYTSNYKQSQFF